jgi:hypothetical protein
MRTCRLLIVTLCLLGPVNLRAARFDINIAYGGWGLSPYTSLVERETESLIKDQLARVLDSVLPRDAISALADIDLSSSGRILSFALWYRFSRFSLGLRTDYYEFAFPYSIRAEQTISFLDYELVRIKTQGGGDVDLSSVMLSLLSRWEVLETPQFGLFVHGGLNVFPYDGRIELQQTTTVTTPLGDAVYTGDLSETIKTIRRWSDEIPSMLFAPVFGLSALYRINPRIGVLLDLTFSQGTFLSGGLCFSL